MKKILLLVITALVAVSTSLSLEPMKVGFVYTGAAPVTVHVQLADNVNNAIFTGEDYLNVSPNNSGVIVLNVRDHAGSASAWANFQASDVSTYNTLDIYIGTTLYAQYRLDALILSQAQNGILDQDGNLVPAENGKGSLGTDELRWSDLFVEGNTVHIGPALGMGAGDELAFSYDDASNTATMTVANKTAMTAVEDAVTIPQQATIDGITVGQGGGDIASNTALGVDALANNTTGFNNTAVGKSALESNNGYSNTAVGVNTLANNTGALNIAIGDGSLNQNTTGYRNTATGASSLASNTIGYQNTATGYAALGSNTDGNDNTATGNNALTSNTTGSGNTATGIASLQSNTTGYNNTAVGRSTMTSNTIGQSNTAIGASALMSNTEGNANTATGINALAGNTLGGNNTATGLNALQNNVNGNRNTANGVEALKSNISGSDNTAIGYRALENNTIGANNTASGYLALRNNTIGGNNTAIGNHSLHNNNDGVDNTAIGRYAGFNIIDGNSNLFLGFGAGNSGSQKTDAENSIAIGANTFTTADNQVVIGNSSITKTQLRGATLVDLAGGGTQNIQVDNTGKLVAAGVNGGGTANGNGSPNLVINNSNITPLSAITLTIESPTLTFYDYSIYTIGSGSFVIYFNNPISVNDKVHYTFVNP